MQTNHPKITDKTEIQYRWLEPEEVTKIEDIDRSERIRVGYKLVGNELQRMAVNWDSPSWAREGEGGYSIAAQINFCREHLSRNGRMFGAFDGDKLVGIGLIQHQVAASTAQLAFLHVSNRYRQRGIGRQIAAELIQEAQRDGAQKMYVSATPSGSAVDFYLSQGFRPTDVPIPELFELEPDDIHMVRDI